MNLQKWCQFYIPVNIRRIRMTEREREREKSQNPERKSYSNTLHPFLFFGIICIFESNFIQVFIKVRTRRVDGNTSRRLNLCKKDPGERGFSSASSSFFSLFILLPLSILFIIIILFFAALTSITVNQLKLRWITIQTHTHPPTLSPHFHTLLTSLNHSLVDHSIWPPQPRDPWWWCGLEKIERSKVCSSSMWK